MANPNHLCRIYVIVTDFVEKVQGNQIRKGRRIFLFLSAFPVLLKREFYNFRDNKTLRKKWQKKSSWLVLFY
ncbi:Uncharacterized protein dnm_083400 [Desulfonema magnum]|uniref:Uncharacterized protein n=1 Tax=Desulfonema magnum TaxID=45655 RepID=A0A975GSP5_9BACT|nr:Uncharacterized protein dnm_083400 [Desulfonema magnum]